MSGPQKRSMTVGSVPLVTACYQDFRRTKSENGREFLYVNIEGKNFLGENIRVYVPRASDGYSR
jgi:hypothetical protein